MGVSGDEELREEGELPDVLAHVRPDSVVRAFFEPLWLLMGTLQVLSSPSPTPSISLRPAGYHRAGPRRIRRILRPAPSASSPRVKALHPLAACKP